MTLTLEDGKTTVYAHKFFLMTASPVFHEVFTAQEDADNIKIPKISKETMVEVCRFAYTDNIRLTQANMMNVLAAATYLQMKFLAEKAIGFISKEGLNATTVFTVLAANQDEKNMLLSMACFKFIEKNHKQVFKSPAFLNIPYETLTLMLQTCKIPQVAAKEAVAKWSAHPANSDGDLDELLSLISLNDYPEETVKETPEQTKQHISDTDSVTSKGSRAKSARGQGRNQGRGGMNGHNQMRGNQYSPNQHQQRPPNQHNFNQSQYSAPTRGPHNNAPMNPSANFVPMKIEANGMKYFALQGRPSRKHFNFANLNFTTLHKKILITEIHFIYDLSATDKEFKMWVADVSQKSKVDLFYDEIKTSNKTNGEFRRYVLPRPCAIPADCKVWITFAFNHGEYRLSYENFFVEPTSSHDLVKLRVDSANPSSAQIVSYFLFKEE